MEVQILRYYLKNFSLILSLLIILLFVFYYIINIKVFNFSNILYIKKGESIDNIIKNELPDINSINFLAFKIYYRYNTLVNNKKIHYGHFSIEEKISYFELLNIISKPSNILNKITIVEGWSQKDLNNELSKYFTDFTPINYNEIIADTYYFNKFDKFNKFYTKLLNYKKKYINNLIDNTFFKKFTIDDLFIIASLIEKEGLDYNDKRNISSVIMNRLKIKMKLQIDATVIYALTEGDYNLNRKLLIKDLKIDHPYNTYIISSLPPKPISYVGTKTIELILENYKTNYLFYFFNKSLNKHIFSENYEQHKLKLNEYRNIK